MKTPFFSACEYVYRKWACKEGFSRKAIFLCIGLNIFVTLPPLYYAFVPQAHFEFDWVQPLGLTYIFQTIAMAVALPIGVACAVHAWKTREPREIYASVILLALAFTPILTAQYLFSGLGAVMHWQLD